MNRYVWKRFIYIQETATAGKEQQEKQLAISITKHKNTSRKKGKKSEKEENKTENLK